MFFSLLASEGKQNIYTNGRLVRRSETWVKGRLALPADRAFTTVNGILHVNPLTGAGSIVD